MIKWMGHMKISNYLIVFILIGACLAISPIISSASFEYQSYQNEILSQNRAITAPTPTLQVISTQYDNPIFLLNADKHKPSSPIFDLQSIDRSRSKPEYMETPRAVQHYNDFPIETTVGTGIYGRVTQNGYSAAGIYLELRYFNGTSWSTKKTTFTDSGGNFSFTSVTSLSSGQTYYVRFLNSMNGYDDSKLWYWGTRSIREYTTGDNVHIGDFDIANIDHVSPADDASVRLPYTFQWTKRTATPDDFYEIYLYDSDYDPDWYMDVRKNNSLRFDCLPPDFSLNYQYRWVINVYGGDGGSGSSYYYQNVSFKNNPSCNGIRGKVTQNGTIVPNLTVELRYTTDNNRWGIASIANTNSSGDYKFINVPDLSAGNQYWVEFYNSDNTNGRLWYWATRFLSSYSQNTNLDMGSFDIGDIDLLSPLGTAGNLPLSFQWVKRNITTDAYKLLLWDDNLFYAFPTGYSDTYSLNCMFPGLISGNQYDWHIQVTSPDGGEGRALYYSWVTINGGPACTNSFLPLILK